MSEALNNLTTASDDVRIETGAVAVADAMVGYETDHWDLSLSARNLTDKQYYGACLTRGDCFPGEARTVNGRAVYKF